MGGRQRWRGRRAGRTWWGRQKNEGFGEQTLGGGTRELGTCLGEGRSRKLLEGEVLGGGKDRKVLEGGE